MSAAVDNIFDLPRKKSKPLTKEQIAEPGLESLYEQPEPEEEPVADGDEEEAEETEPSTAPMRFQWERALRGYRWVTTTEIAVAFILATYSDADGSSCFPEVETLARDVGKSASTIQRALRRLEQFGFIKTTPRLGQSNSYQLTLPKGKG